MDYPADKENTYERVEFLYKKMLALEHSIEDVISNYGDMASIPTVILGYFFKLFLYRLMKRLCKFWKGRKQKLWS